MKLHHLYLFFFGLILIAAGTIRASGDDVLDRVISLPRMKGTVYSLLGKVSERSGYLFVYDSKVVNNDVVTKTKEKDCTVRQAIYEITGNRSLVLKVIGGHILILPPVEKNKNIKKESQLP